MSRLVLNLPQWWQDDQELGDARGYGVVAKPHRKENSAPQGEPTVASQEASQAQM
jgi:hypothetical protein